ncbi:unnamed protein product, partial [Discosporangium mesarthrocarpum]
MTMSCTNGSSVVQLNGLDSMEGDGDAANGSLGGVTAGRNERAKFEVWSSKSHLFCTECEDTRATVLCEGCEEEYCLLCWASLHRKGARARHTTVPISPAALEEALPPDMAKAGSSWLSGVWSSQGQGQGQEKGLWANLEPDLRAPSVAAEGGEGRGPVWGGSSGNNGAAEDRTGGGGRGEHSHKRKGGEAASSVRNGHRAIGPDHNGHGAGLSHDGSGYCRVIPDGNSHGTIPKGHRARLNGDPPRVESRAN